MRNLKDSLRLSYLYITHDLATARFIGDDVGIMYLRKIVEVGPIEQVLLNPLHPYTQALLDAISEPEIHNLKKEKSSVLSRVKQEKDLRQVVDSFIDVFILWISAKVIPY